MFVPMQRRQKVLEASVERKWTRAQIKAKVLLVYVCVCEYVCVCIYMCVYIYVYECVYTCVRQIKCVCACVCERKKEGKREKVCVFVCVCIFMREGELDFGSTEVIIRNTVPTNLLFLIMTLHASLSYLIHDFT